MYKFLLIVLFVQSLPVLAQKKEEGFDYSFKPTSNTPRYYVITEQKSGGWYREAYYLPERTLAMKGWYKDEACKIPDGEIIWYHSNKYMKSKRQYQGGKGEGIWLGFHDNGMISDSAFYKSGKRYGVSLNWDNRGYQIDSTNFDGNGSGTQVTWYSEGLVRAAGRWVQDTLKHGKWVYYHPNGKVKATEIYNKGEKGACECFTETEIALDSSLCEEKSAAFPGEEGGWRKFVAINLNAEVPIKKKAPVGTYTVAVRFVVDIDGDIKEIYPLTNFGYGMEKEVIRLLKASPKWSPARQFGKNVRAYRIQPVTFGVVED